MLHSSRTQNPMSTILDRSSGPRAFYGGLFSAPSVPESAYMETIFARLALVLIVAVIVGGATYVVLTIMEILQKK